MLYNVVNKAAVSKLDYKNEIMDSVKEGAVVTGVTINGCMILKYPFKVSLPSRKLDIIDVGKLGLGIVSGVLVDPYEVQCYAVQQKWINYL